MDIRRVLTYTDNCRRTLQATLAAHPEAVDAPLETIGEYKSIHALVAHCVGAEQRWTEQRLHGQAGSARYESCAAETLTGLFRDWEHIRAKTRAVVEAGRDTTQAPRLHQEVVFSLPQWKHTDILTVEEMLFHVFNHQIYHLGQISMALQQQGIDPPNFDYVFLHQDPDE